jgi:hypothetical protein
MAKVAGAAEGEKPLVRSWTSRTGHRITVHDDADNKIEIETAGKHRATFDDAGKTITIVSSGGLELKMDDNSSKITLTSGGAIEVTATGDLSMKGANVKVEASGTMALEAGGPATLKGATVSIASVSCALILVVGCMNWSLPLSMWRRWRLPANMCILP